MSRKEYYRSEVFRALLYPLVFVIIAYIVTQTGIFGEAFMPDDLRIYFGVALLGAVSLMVLYAITLRHRYFRRK